MTFFGVLLTVLGAVLVGILFYYAFKSTGPWGSFWSFLLILILAGLAAEAWVDPVGPTIWGVAWIPIILVILIFALLLSAATPARRRQRRPMETPPPETEESEEETAAVAVSGFFWLFLVILLGIILWGAII